MTRKEFVDRFFQSRNIYDRKYCPNSAFFTWEELKEIITGHILPLEYLPWLVRGEFHTLSQTTTSPYYGAPVTYVMRNQDEVFGFQYVFEPFSVYRAFDFAGSLQHDERVWEELHYSLQAIERMILETMRKYIGVAFSEPFILLEPFRNTEAERKEFVKEFGKKSPPLGDEFAIEIEVKPKP